MLNNGEGELILVKRPRRKIGAHHALPCSHCFGFYVSRFLKSHMNTCAFRAENDATSSVAASRLCVLAMLPKTALMDEELKQLFSGLYETKANPGK